MPLCLEETTGHVRLIGRLGIEEGDSLRTSVLGCLESGAREVVLDLGEAEFLCSSIIGHIIGAHVNCKRHGAALRVIRVSDRLRSVFDITNLSRILRIE
jgi:anti-anti-sigma factor